MNKYFENIETLEDLKKQYKKLAVKYHPDATGQDTTEEMKQLNSEYTELFKKYKNIHKDINGSFYEKETQEQENEFTAIIDQLIKLNGVDIEIIGSFIWVSGDTKPYIHILKSLGFKWHSKKINWYKAPDNYRIKSRKNYDMEDLRTMYGSEKIKKSNIKKKLIS